MSELFAGFGNELPTVTQIVRRPLALAVGNVLWFGPLIIGGAIVLVLWSRTPSRRLKLRCNFDLKIPLAGNLACNCQWRRRRARWRRCWPAASRWLSRGRSRRSRSRILRTAASQFVDPADDSRRALVYREFGDGGLDAAARDRHDRNRRTIGQFARDARRSCGLLRCRIEVRLSS
jgi:hypothetical protein